MAEFAVSVKTAAEVCVVTHVRAKLHRSEHRVCRVLG